MSSSMSSSSTTDFLSPYGYSRSNDDFSWDDLFFDVSTIPDTGYGYFQLVSLLIIYFGLLWLGSYLIVSGTELLIFIPGMSSIVGSIILPVLGQFPMILLSIFAGFGADAQAELEVGVGALAGGIVGQVSIYGFLSILLGAVNIDEETGAADYSKKGKAKAPSSYYDYWFLSGVKIGKYTPLSTTYVLVTAFPFVIILIPNIIYVEDRYRDLTVDEQPYDIFGFVFAFLLFLIFVANQYVITSSNDDTPYFDVREQIMVTSVRRKLMSLMSLLATEVEMAEEEQRDNAEIIQRSTASANNTSGSDSEGPRKNSSPSPRPSASEGSPLVPQQLEKKSLNILKRKLQHIVTPFFTAEHLSLRQISMSDLLVLFHYLGEKYMTIAMLDNIFSEHEDTNPSNMESDLPSPTGPLSMLFTSKTNGNGDAPLPQRQPSYGRALLGMSDPGSDVGRKKAKTIGLDDVIDGLAKFLLRHKEFEGEARQMAQRERENPFEAFEAVEDMGEFPSDLNEMSNEDQLFYIRFRASILLVGGLLLSIYAVDPIILAMDEFSTRVGISAYYVAFIIVGGVDVPTILAISRYAVKRTERTTSICQDTILGSVIILNTLGLGTFLAIIYSQGLAWEYLAEASTILIALGLASALFLSKPLLTMFDGLMLALLFPLALGIVALMRTYGFT